MSSSLSSKSHVHIPAALLFQAFRETPVCADICEQHLYFHLDANEDFLDLQSFMTSVMKEAGSHENPLLVMKRSRHALKVAQRQMGEAIAAFHRYVSFSQNVVELAGLAKERVRVPAEILPDVTK